MRGRAHAAGRRVERCFGVCADARRECDARQTAVRLVARRSACAHPSSLAPPLSTHLRPRSTGMESSRSVQTVVADVTPAGPEKGGPRVPSPLYNDVKFMSWNLCWSRRAGPPFTFEDRFQLIQDVLKREDADVVFLQEVPVTRSDDVRRVFGDGYRWHPVHHSSRNGACMLTIVVREHPRLEKAVVSEWPVSWTEPDGTEHTEQCVGVVFFPWTELLLVNAHLPTSSAARAAALDVLAGGVRARASAHTRVVVWGDLNTFGDDGGAEWLATLAREADLTHVVPPGAASFAPYPYDRVQVAPGKEGLTIPLDNGLLRNVTARGPTFLHGQGDVGTFDHGGRTWWCSDHFATVVTLGLGRRDGIMLVVPPVGKVVVDHATGSVTGPTLAFHGASVSFEHNVVEVDAYDHDASSRADAARALSRAGCDDAVVGELERVGDAHTQRGFWRAKRTRAAGEPWVVVFGPGECVGAHAYPRAVTFEVLAGAAAVWVTEVPVDTPVPFGERVPWEVPRIVHRGAVVTVAANAVHAIMASGDTAVVLELEGAPEPVPMVWVGVPPPWAEEKNLLFWRARGGAASPMEGGVLTKIYGGGDVSRW